MNFDDFKKSMESPIHKSVEDLFNRAELNQKERNIFKKYEKESKNWLLRSKLQYSSQLNENNYIKQIAAVLINLQSKRVKGKKDKIVKEMFAGNVHKIEETKNGFRSRKNTSNKIDSMFFELKILSYFLINTKWSFILPDNRIGKIPEYIVETENGNINIEAKLLNVDKIMDNIFGDDFIEDIFKRREEDKEKGYIRIKDQVKRNYEYSIEKYENISENEYFLLFMEGYYKFEYMGRSVGKYLDEIVLEWSDSKYNKLMGIVFLDSDKTLFIENKKCDPQIINCIKPWIYEFNNYIPIIIENL